MVLVVRITLTSVNLVHNAPPLAEKTQKKKKKKKKGLCWPGQCPETARTDGQTDRHVTLIYKIVCGFFFSLTPLPFGVL